MNARAIGAELRSILLHVIDDHFQLLCVNHGISHPRLQIARAFFGPDGRLYEKGVGRCWLMLNLRLHLLVERPLDFDFGPKLFV